MARLTLNIEDKVDMQFRDMVYKTMGWREDNLITALEEAIAIWIEAKKVMLKNSEPWPEEEWSGPLFLGTLSPLFDRYS